MCDTMVALGNSTKSGSVIFAKNSDRQPNEPHIIIRVPRKTYNKGETLKCTYINIEQAEETYEVLLLKPSWIWGCEMGCNEYGLNIGNEAVFTKEKYGEDSLIGMDMVRIALERCRTSEEALDLIIELLDKYGQGGNCGFNKKFTYHNSFLIADKESAWVLETAGKYWAAEKVKDIRTISNCLSIGNKFDKAHPDLIKNAIDKKWCKSEQDFSFAKCYSDPVFTYFSEAKKRQQLSSNVLEREKGNITVETMRDILRLHQDKVDNKQFTKHSIGSVCMHGGFLFGDHTTGSYIVELNEKMSTYWITGSSTPCISVFKPYWLIENENLSFNENETNEAVEYWLRREKIHRMMIEHKIELSSFLKDRDELELKLLSMVNNIDVNEADQSELSEIINYAIKKESEFVEKTIESNKYSKGRIRGNFYYKSYWKKQNKALKG